MYDSKAWTAIIEKFEESTYKWQVVRGQIAATIAALMDTGVEPSSPAFWKFPGGVEPRLTDDDVPRLLRQIIQRVCGGSSLGALIYGTAMDQDWKGGILPRFGFALGKLEKNFHLKQQAR